MTQTKANFVAGVEKNPSDFRKSADPRPEVGGGNKGDFQRLRGPRTFLVGEVEGPSHQKKNGAVNTKKPVNGEVRDGEAVVARWSATRIP